MLKMESGEERLIVMKLWLTMHRHWHRIWYPDLPADDAILAHKIVACIYIADAEGHPLNDKELAAEANMAPRTLRRRLNDHIVPRQYVVRNNGRWYMNRANLTARPGQESVKAMRATFVEAMEAWGKIGAKAFCSFGLLWPFWPRVTNLVL